MQSPSSRIEDDADIRAALEWFQQVTEDRSDLLQRMRAAEPRNLAGDLRESVVLSCASWCQLQRTPLGKLLKLCAVQRHGLPAGVRPARQLSLQPVAIGAVVEVTKRLKPSM